MHPPDLPLIGNKLLGKIEGVHKELVENPVERVERGNT
jgi:hypothetical protein